jgi:hypothetical protein
MKKLLYAAVLALVMVPAFAQNVGVGVNITIGQPGFYGQIVLGNAPPPEVIYPQPVVIVPGPAMAPPIYLRVPPGHERHWRRYCHEYNACGRPVYFVRDRWYNDVYVPHYRRHEDEYRRHPGDWRDEGRGYEGRPGYDRGPGPGYDRGPGRGDDRHEGRGDDRRDEGRGGEHRRGDDDRGR